jgi:hypothetical protein
MAKLVQQSTANDPLFFFLVLTSDHISPATGLAPTVTISKNGAAFGAPAGAVTEIGNGWYQVAGNATDTNTLGDILLHASVATADNCDLVAAQVVAFNPRNANLGITNVSANVAQWNGTNVSAPATAGIPDVNVKNINNVAAATPGASGGILIAGSNAATVTFADGIVVNRSTANSDAMQLNGSGSGNGLKATGGAASGATAGGNGVVFTGGAASTTGGGTAGVGFQATGGAGAASTNGAAAGLAATAGGTTTVSGNDGMVVTGTGNGNGLTAAHAGTGKDLNATTSPPLQVNTTQIAGVAVVLDANNLLKVDVEDVGGAALATHAAGMMPADVRDIAGAAVSTTTAQLGVNVVQYNGQTAQTDANNLPKVDVEDVGGAALATHAAGMVPADVRDIAGAAVSTTTAQIGANVVTYAGATAAVDANNLPKVDVEDVNGNATAAQNVSRANQAIVRGTVGSGSTATSIVCSSITTPGSLTAAGQLNGRTVIFDSNTTTASLQGQATNITNNTTGATPTLTVTALTTAPVAGDTFSVL